MDHNVVVAHHEAGEGSLKSYTIGFGLSVILTIIAFVIVSQDLVEGSLRVAAIMLLAVIQLYVQAVFFLHLGRGSDKRWNRIVFIFMLLIVSIVVGGTLWIMSNLNYNHGHQSPKEIEQSIIQDEGYKN